MAVLGRRLGGEAIFLAATDRFRLQLDPDTEADGRRGVTVSGLDGRASGGAAGTVGDGVAALRVRVAGSDDSGDGERPDVAGILEIGHDTIRFVPDFPFSQNVRYCATFDPRPFRSCNLTATTIDFAISGVVDAVGPEVMEIYPSSDELPENLLRLYVRFSKPMRRGSTRTGIRLTDAEGRPVEDALYRAPVELWDPSMRWLTILLDPGRLKRGVGPNRDLGPPLTAKTGYLLEIGSELADIDGICLSGTVRKRFRTSAPVREAVDSASWSVTAPPADTRDPIIVRFPHPLDWALLVGGLQVTIDDVSVEGMSTIGEGEKEWRFEPSRPWKGRAHDIQVASSIEDVCGNGFAGAFDRPLRIDGASPGDAGSNSIAFTPV